LRADAAGRTLDAESTQAYWWALGAAVAVEPFVRRALRE
jgi:hypothetical protein